MNMDKKSQTIETIKYLTERIDEQKKILFKAKERLNELIETKKFMENKLNEL